MNNTDEGVDSQNRNGSAKAAIVILPIPEELKESGIKGISFLGSVLTIEYQNETIVSTLYKDDPIKTFAALDKTLGSTIDGSLKKGIKWVLSSNWLNLVYTEEEINKIALARSGKAEAVLEIVGTACKQVFLDEYKIAHAAITIEDHLETLPIASKRFKSWIRKTMHKEEDVVIGSQVIEDVVNALIADAEFDRKTRELALRNASALDDEFKWYYDLTNDPWEFIEITSEEWKISKNAIIFRRFSHQQPQVYPVKDYPSDIFDQFMNLLNVKKENRLILKCYIISTLIPNLPKAVLMIHGEQGTAKSMLEELIKTLVDPSIIRTLSFPKDMAELIQQLSHHAVTYYDNLSRIPEWISDLLCRAVTGSGFSKRELYTDDGDVVYCLMRAIGFNGINLAATKPDLLDRGLIIQTETIPKGDRRKMKAIWDEFYAMRSQILGYIFDILVKVLKWKKDNPKLELIKDLPRMADWTEWCEIISRCMGEDDDAFINAYSQNISLQTEVVIEGSDLAIAVRELATKEPESSQTATELLTRLNMVADVNNIDKHNRYWPKTAARLSCSLKLLQRTLRDIGIEVSWEKDTSTKKSTRMIVIRKLPSEPSERQKNNDTAQDEGQNSDDTKNEEINVSSEEHAESVRKIGFLTI